MKIAVAATGRDLEASTDPRFGRCSAFIIVETDDLTYEVVDNTAATQGSGAGIAAVQLVADSGADAVIAANIGPNAFSALSAGGLRVYSFSEGTVREAIAALLAGKLEETPMANVPSHHGMTTPSAQGKSAATNAQLQNLRDQLNQLPRQQG